MSDELKLSDVPHMSISAIVDALSSAYGTLLAQGRALHTMPSIMLWGPPGVGKSQAVRQIAERIECEQGKRVHITDVRLLLFNPIDLRGIPTANADKTLAVWLKPQIFQMDESEDVVNILFLDEITAAPQSVQAAAYQITLDRVVGEHALPENCIVIAAGNRTTDKSVAYKMPKALANRLLHIEVDVLFDAWRRWAVAHAINENVLGFLSFRQDLLHVSEQSADALAFPTPRTWEMVSDLLSEVSDDVEAMLPLICGLVGNGAAMELRTWTSVYAELPSIEGIFSGKAPSAPKRADLCYALVSSMTAYAREHRDDMEAIANSIRFADNLAPEYGMLLMDDYLNLEPNYRSKLMMIPEFMHWMEKRGALLNAV